MSIDRANANRRLFKDLYPKPDRRSHFWLREAGCSRAHLLQVAGDPYPKLIAVACESVRCPDCGPKRKAETMRRLQLGLTVSIAMRAGAPVWFFTMTMPSHVSVEAGMSAGDVYRYAVSKVQKIINRAKARARKACRERADYFVVYEVQPKRGSVAPHLLWVGEEGPFPESIMNPRMEVYSGQLTNKARGQREQTSEYRKRAKYLEQMGCGWHHLLEPCVDAAATAGYVAKYIAKNIGNEAAGAFLPPRARGFSNSEGFMPTRDEWRILYRRIDLVAWAEAQAMANMRLMPEEEERELERTIRTQRIRRFVSAIPIRSGVRENYGWVTECGFFDATADRRFWKDEAFQEVVRGEFEPSAGPVDREREDGRGYFVTALQECSTAIDNRDSKAR